MQTAQRNHNIDLLRGLSIFLVVVHHLALRISLKETALAAILPNTIIEGLSWSGNEAVFIFFVISGFLIASNTISRWGRVGTIDAPNFYARRASRILPCLFGLVAILSALHLLGVSAFKITHPTQSLGGAVSAALGLYLNWYEGQTGYLPGNWDILWSLSIEEVFYLAFPLVCLLFRRDKILAPLLLLFGFALPFLRASVIGGEIWLEKAYLPGMAAIATGVFGAIVAEKFTPTRAALRALQILAVIGITTVICFNRWAWHNFHEGALLLLTFSTAGFLLYSFWQQKSGHLKAIRGLGWLESQGRLSYEIYLTHMFIVWPVVDAFKATGAHSWWGFIWFVPVVLFSWLLGSLVSKYFTVPVEKKLKTWLLRPRANVLPVTAPA